MDSLCPRQPRLCLRPVAQPPPAFLHHPALPGWAPPIAPHPYPGVAFHPPPAGVPHPGYHQPLPYDPYTPRPPLTPLRLEPSSRPSLGRPYHPSSWATISAPCSLARFARVFAPSPGLFLAASTTLSNAPSDTTLRLSKGCARGGPQLDSAYPWPGPAKTSPPPLRLSGALSRPP
jgi:hypothetical protein